MITHNGEIAKKLLCLDNCELKCENFLGVKTKDFHETMHGSLAIFNGALASPREILL